MTTLNLHSLSATEKCRSNLALADVLIKSDACAASVIALSFDAEDHEIEKEQASLSLQCGDPLLNSGNFTTAVDCIDATASFDGSDKPAKLDRLLGIVCILLAGLAMTIYGISSQKLMSKGVSTLQINCVRHGGVLIITIVWLIHRRTNPLKCDIVRIWGTLLLVRGIVGSVGQLALVYTLAKLPVGDATALGYSSPIFVGIFATLILRERYRLIYIVTTATILLGCVLIARPRALFADENYILNDPTSTDDRLTGTFSGITNAFCGAFIIILVRKLRLVNAVVILFYYSTIGCVIAFGAILIPASPLPVPSANSASVLIYCGILVASGVGSQIFLALSLQYEDANVIALVRNTEVVWAFVAQFVVFSIKPHFLSFAGASVIIASVFCLGALKMTEMRSAKNR